MRIYKYPLKLEVVQKVEMPEDAKILSAQLQNGVLCIWALVSTDRELEDRTIHTIGTGWETDFLYKFISTVQIDGLVWHIFDGGS